MWTPTTPSKTRPWASRLRVSTRYNTTAERLKPAPLGVEQLRCERRHVPSRRLEISEGVALAHPPPPPHGRGTPLPTPSNEVRRRRRQARAKDAKAPRWRPPAWGPNIQGCVVSRVPLVSDRSRRGRPPTCDWGVFNNWASRGKPLPPSTPPSTPTVALLSPYNPGAVGPPESALSRRAVQLAPIVVRLCAKSGACPKRVGASCIA